MDQNSLPDNRPPRTITNKTAAHSLSVMCKARDTPQAIRHIFTSDACNKRPRSTFYGVVTSSGETSYIYVRPVGKLCNTTGTR